MFGGPSVNATRCGVDLWPNLPASLNGTFATRRGAASGAFWDACSGTLVVRRSAPRAVDLVGVQYSGEASSGGLARRRFSAASYAGCTLNCAPMWTKPIVSARRCDGSGRARHCGRRPSATACRTAAAAARRPWSRRR
jgi:hypothetical protein